MITKLSKISISIIASMVLAGDAIALDPAITNFGYVNSMGNSTLTIFNAADPTKTKTITGVTRDSLGISPTGAWFYVVNPNIGTITRYNAYSGATIGSDISVGANPANIIVSSDGSKLYVTNYNSNTVSIINTAASTVTATVNVGSNPNGITLSTDGSKAYVANTSDSTVSVINTTTNTVASTVNVGGTPVGVAISPDGSKVYVGNYSSGTVSVIDTATNSVTATVNTGSNPFGIAISHDGSKVYVGNYSSGTVSVIDTATNSVTATIGGVAGAEGVSISPDGSKLYVTNYDSNALYVIDTTTNALMTYSSLSTTNAGNLSPFISPNLITGTLSVSSAADMNAKGFSNYVNFAGGTLRATGSFTLSNPIYLHDAFNLTYDDSSTFATVAGGTVDTNGYNVTLSGEVSGVGGLTKSGAGTLTISGANTYAGETIVNQGILEFVGGTRTLGAFTVKSGAFLNVVGNLALTNSSIYKVYADPSGTAGKVSVTGSANLDGTVSVIAGNGTWSASTDYTILQAVGGVNGTFGSVSTNLAFLTPTLSYDANNVYLTLTRNQSTYSPYAVNSSGLGAARVLDGMSTPNADMSVLTTTLNSMSASQASSALTQLGGASLGGSYKAAVSSSSMFQSVMSSRMSSVSSGGGIGLASLRFTDNGDWSSVFKHLADAGVVGKDGWIEPKKELPYMVWARGIAGRTNNAGDSAIGISSSTTNMGGLQMGVDKKVGDSLYGVSFGVVSTALRYSGDSTDVDGKSYTLGLYGSHEMGDIKLQGSAQYTIANNSSQRTAPTGTAKADYDSKSANMWAQSSYGYKIQKGLILEPYMEGTYSYYSQAEYDESGATGANLRVSEYSAKRYGIGAGAKITKEFDDKKGSFDFSLGAVREWGDLNKPLNMAFSAAPSSGSWNTQGVDTSNTLYKMATGVAYKVANSTEIFGNLEASKRLNENSIMGIAGVRIGF